MAIFVRCLDCKKEFKLGKKRCVCGANLEKRRKYRVSVRMPNGKRKLQVVDSLETAQNVEGKFRTMKVEVQVFDLQPFPILSVAWNSYAKWAETNKRSWKDDKQRWGHHIKPTLGSKRMDKIRPAEIQAVLDTMKVSVSPRTERPYRPSTIKQVYALIRRLYNWSMKQGICPDTIPNPCGKAEIPKFDNKVTRALSGDELGRLSETLDSWDSNERAVLVIKFALYTGKRRGEILKLTWDSVDVINGYVSFKTETTKNNRTQVLPVGDNALTVLKRCEELKVSQWVFPSLTGNYFHSFDCVWKRIRKKAELKRFRFHDLRHTYASYLASSGKVDIYTLKELLGHRSLDMTQRYAHLINGALRRAVSVADEVFPSVG